MNISEIVAEIERAHAEWMLKGEEVEFDYATVLMEHWPALRAALATPEYERKTTDEERRGMFVEFLQCVPDVSDDPQESVRIAKAVLADLRAAELALAAAQRELKEARK